MSNALKLLLEKTEFSLTDDFSDTQGPIWYYKYGDKDSGEVSELQEYDADTPRWKDNKDKWLRIFNDGMMPGNKGDDAILEWKDVYKRQGEYGPEFDSRTAGDHRGESGGDKAMDC